MINKEQKRMLIELIKDGIMTFDILSNEIDNEIKSIVGVRDIEVIKDFVLECFELGYIKTSDGQLSRDNLTSANRKLLIIDMERVFTEDILKEFDEYKELKAWFKNSEEDMKLLSDKAIFLSSLDNTEHIETSKVIVICESAICKTMNMMARPLHPGQEELLLYNQEFVFISNINTIQTEINALPERYHYAKELYSFKNYYGASKRLHSKLFSRYNRNDLCPCGSGKKFKKCCLA